MFVWVENFGRLESLCGVEDYGGLEERSEEEGASIQDRKATSCYVSPKGE